jgi:hypothetical protein
VSDIGIVFPVWFTVGFVLLFALPVTTAVLAGLGIAWRRIRRRDSARRLTALKWSVMAVAPFWLAGLGFGGSLLVAEIERAISESQHYFMLNKVTEIDGVSLPAGTRVELDDDHALRVAELPEGTTVALRGATWQGKLEFAMPAHAPNGARGQITAGTLAAPAVIEGVPCQPGNHQSGNQVAFFWGGQLMECTLSQDTDIAATIADANGATHSQRFRCLAGDTIQLDGLRPGELAGCRLAEPADFGTIACAAGERILVSNGSLSACTFATAARFGPLDLPAGATVTYYDTRPSNFRLPPQGAAVEGFGLSLPPGTDGTFCYRSEALERLEVSRTTYVTVAGIKLTGLVDFNCGAFQSGSLFEDAVVGGKWRQRGDLVSRAELFPQQGG